MPCQRKTTLESLSPVTSRPRCSAIHAAWNASASASTGASRSRSCVSPRVEQRRAGDQRLRAAARRSRPGAGRPTRRRARGERRGRAPRAVRAEARGETYPDARLESSRCRRHARSRASQSSSRSSARCTVSLYVPFVSRTSARTATRTSRRRRRSLDGAYSTPLVAGFYYTTRSASSTSRACT